MSAIGLYFRGLTKAQTNALRARLNELAALYCYTSRRGPTAEQGNLAALLVAIDAGKVATVLLADGDLAPALAHLDQVDAPWARSIAASLRLALQYQAEATANEEY